MEFPDGRPRLQALLGDQRRAQPGVHGQGFGLPSRPVQGEHEQRVQPEPAVPGGSPVPPTPPPCVGGPRRVAVRAGFPGRGGPRRRSASRRTASRRPSASRRTPARLAGRDRSPVRQWWCTRRSRPPDCRAWPGRQSRSQAALRTWLRRSGPALDRGRAEQQQVSVDVHGEQHPRQRPRPQAPGDRISWSGSAAMDPVRSTSNNFRCSPSWNSVSAAIQGSGQPFGGQDHRRRKRIAAGETS